VFSVTPFTRRLISVHDIRLCRDIYDPHAPLSLSLPAKMSLQDSSSFPIPTFEELDGASPKNLLTFLQTFIDRIKNDKGDLRRERTRLLSLFESLNKSFIPPLPLPEAYPWNSMHERSAVSEVTFDMLYRLSKRCGEVFLYKEDLSKSIFVKLLDFCVSAEIWIDVPDVPVKEGFPSPETLRAGCVHATVGMLRALAENIKIDYAGKPGWQILRSIAEECLAVCQGMKHSL
jgi:hypothetical protein